jgi:hypothetical protein
MSDPRPHADPNSPAGPLPGKGVFGWLGRQIGYVKKAVKQDVRERTIYDNRSVHEAPHPEDPNVVLRRTTIDQAVHKPKRDA